MKTLNLILILTGVIGLLTLAPAVASADSMTSFTLFAGNQMSLNPGNFVSGKIGGNGTISIDNNLNLASPNLLTILGGGAISLNNVDLVTGNITSNGNVTLANSDHVTGNIDSGGNVSIGNGSIVDGNVRAAGTVTLSVNAKVLGNVDAGAASGTAVGLHATAQIVGTVTHKPGTTVSGGTVGANVVGTPAPPTAYTPTTIPLATVFSAGSSNVTVPNFGTQILAPGAYKDITLGSTATLKLSTGTYYFEDWIFDNFSKLDLDVTSGPLLMYFTGNAGLGQNLDVTLIGGDASKVAAETLGNWNQGNGSEWFGTIFASGVGSDISFGANNKLTGAAWANDRLTTDQNFNLTALPPPVVGPTAAPVPPSILLMGIGGVGLAITRLRRKIGSIVKRSLMSERVG